jgi:hypothetical protein
VSKIDEALAKIQLVEDTSERALQLAGLISTLLKLKGVVPVVIGQTALDCYTNGQGGPAELNLSVHSGKVSPRIMQEVFGEQLLAKGLLMEWQVAQINVKMEEEFISEHKEMCRDFKTDFGTVKLIPAEDLTAAKLWQATRPEVGEAALLQAKKLLVNALAETFVMDWDVLEQICASPAFQVELLLEEYRAEAQQELDAYLLEQALAENAAAEAAMQQASAGPSGGTVVTAAAPIVRPPTPGVATVKPSIKVPSPQV